MLSIKKILIGLSLAIVCSMTTNGNEFYNRDCSQDTNGCQVRVALKVSEFNKYSIGREVYQVHDPKVDNYGEYNALTAHTCDVFPRKSRLITKLEFSDNNQWKVRALNIFLFHVRHDCETIYAWVAAENDIARKMLTSRFGFKDSNTRLHHLGTQDCGIEGITDIFVPNGMHQLEATTGDIFTNLVLK